MYLLIWLLLHAGRKSSLFGRTNDSPSREKLLSSGPTSGPSTSQALPQLSVILESNTHLPALQPLGMDSHGRPLAIAVTPTFDTPIPPASIQTAALPTEPSAPHIWDGLPELAPSQSPRLPPASPHPHLGQQDRSPTIGGSIPPPSLSVQNVDGSLINWDSNPAFNSVEGTPASSTASLPHRVSHPTPGWAPLDRGDAAAASARSTTPMRAGRPGALVMPRALPTGFSSLGGILSEIEAGSPHLPPPPPQALDNEPSLLTLAIPSPPDVYGEDGDQEDEVGVHHSAASGLSGASSGAATMIIHGSPAGWI